MTRNFTRKGMKLSGFFGDTRGFGGFARVMISGTVCFLLFFTVALITMGKPPAMPGD
jgi:hypothetical protein